MSAYEPNAINMDILSVLDVTASGKVVSAETWTELWKLVFTHLNSIDAYCVSLDDVIQSVEDSSAAFQEAVAQINDKYDALTQGLVHYGDTAPEHPDVKLWVQPVGDVNPDTLVRKRDLAEIIVQVTGHELNDIAGIEQHRIYQCSSNKSKDENITILNIFGALDSAFRAGYFYEYQGDNTYFMVQVQPHQDIPNNFVELVASSWLNTTPAAAFQGKTVQCTDTGNGFTAGYFYKSTQTNSTWSWQQKDVQPHQSLSAYATKSELPTKTSDLTNDSGFITKAVGDLTNYYLKSEIYTKTEVNSLINAISTMSLEVVQTLPVQDIQTNVIYLVPKSSSQTQNVYDEYIYVNNAWEKIGDTQIDLSGYATKVSGATTGNLAGLDANGNITDSGKSPSDIPLLDQTYSAASTHAQSGVAVAQAIANKEERQKVLDYLTYSISTSNGSVTITGFQNDIPAVLSIPAFIAGYPVKSIDFEAFKNCTNLTSVTIPDGVTMVGNNAFQGCTNLVSVSLPDSTTTLGSAFIDCTSLLTVSIPKNITSIGNYTFLGCTGLTSVTVPGGITSIGYQAFHNCSSLTVVYYAGTQTAWGQITVDSDNTELTGATIYHNQEPANKAYVLDMVGDVESALVLLRGGSAS